MVKLPAAKEGNYTMNISDATGNIIGSASLKASDLAGYEVNLQHYMPGIYTVQIIGGDMNLVKRVVKKN